MAEQGTHNSLVAGSNPVPSTNKLYWDVKKTLSYNCLFNFVIGMRGVGKTFGSLEYALNRFKRNATKGKKWQFLYVRRMKTELNKLTTMRGGRLFNAIQKKYPKDELKAESNVLYCNGEVCGYAQALSTASILKSDSFPDVQLIIFDEFIIDNSGTYHYLKDEVTKFFDLYETVARGRDVTVLFLSNAVTITNPYFDFFHLDKPMNGSIQRFGKSQDILVEWTTNPNLSRLKKETRFGQIIDGTEYSDYAYDNEWLLDNTDFIGKKSMRSTYFVTLRYKETWIGVWFDNLQWLYFISEDVDRQCNRVYSVTTDDHKPNVMLLKGAKKLNFMRNLIDAYKAGAIRYESMKLKNWFRDIMRMCG